MRDQLSAIVLVACSMLWTCGTLLTCNKLNAQEQQRFVHPEWDLNAAPVNYPNLEMKTGGGKQFWTDLIYRDGWRIQQNAYTQGFRLLDPKENRHAWGNLAACWQKLQTVSAKENIGKNPEEVVILLHGLGRTRFSLEQLEKYLPEKHNLPTIAMSYASTRNTLDDHADALHFLLANSPETTKVHFVCHSLGNLVVRRFLKKLEEHPLPHKIEFGRMVMLAPPNQGAELSRRFKDNALLNLIWGKSGKQLAKSWTDTEKALAVPDFEFAILAGNEPIPYVSNLLINGEDDLVVSVEETKLPGATDFREVPCAHTFIMDDPKVLEMTAHFLKTGTLEGKEKLNPLPASR